jgi:hypothetical protein
MRKFLTLTLAGAALAVGGAAYPQAGVATDQAPARTGAPVGQPDREARRHTMFERLDADHNGAISYSEFTALTDRVGQRLRDRRGARLEGFARGGRAARGQRSAALDGNRDGAVNRDEFAAAMMRRFDRLDADHDGRITPDERQAGMRGSQGQRF